MKKKIVLSLFVLGIGHQGISQKVDLNNQVVEYIKKSTPQASQFQKYGDVPVNANTGAVDISIPFFKVGIKNVDWNIGIGYHTGGIKVSELAGTAGLGWALNAGGMISAKIYQRCDVFLENTGNDTAYRRTLNVWPINDPAFQAPCTYGSDIAIAVYIDAQKANEDTKFQMNYIPDIFYLNAGSLNAKFFLKKDTGYCLPSKDISIIHTQGAYTNNNNYPGSWMVIDETGTKYTFEAKGGSATNYYSTVGALDTSWAYPTIYSSYNPVFALTQIENVFGEKINLYYSTECYQYRLPDQDEYRDYASGNNECTNSGDGFFVPSHKEGQHEVCDARLDSIATTNGQVIIFKYSSRSDLIGASKLDTVALYSRSSTATSFIKSYALNTSYFGSGSNPRELRLRLDSLGELNATGTVNAKYHFEYNPDSLPSRISPAQDSSGFYNGQTGNSNLVPYYGGTRNYSLTHTKACVLEKVRYPTGGYTLLEYELKNYGGLRIKSIKDSLDASTVNLREYEYGSTYVVGDNSYAFSKDINEYQYVCHSDSQPKDEILCLYTATYSDPLSTLSGSYYGDNTQRYISVTEYYGSSGTNGKIEYKYAYPYLILQTGQIGQDEFLIEKNTYKKNGSSYELITKEKKAYIVLAESGTMFSDPTNTREKRSWGLDFDKGRDQFETTNLDCGSAWGASICYPARYFQVALRLVSSPVMVKSDTTIFYSNDTLLTSKRYQYNVESVLAPVSTYTNDSKGNIRVETFKYSVEYPGITENDTLSAGIKNLINKHIFSPIEQMVFLKNSDSSNTRQISSVFTSYRQDMPVPYRLYALPITTPLTSYFVSTVSNGSVVKNGDYETRILFNSYDAKGNLLEQQKVNDMRLNYLWDHNYTLPIAQVSNADSSSIAYTSFEADSKGGWTYSGTVYPSLGMTGSNSYSVGGGDITKSGLANTTYIVSYWGYNGSVNVNSAGPTRTGKVIGSWTYYEHEVTGTSITVSGSNYIDELRLYPKGAQMTTYTFSPMVGMTSQCDATNKIINYEYDSFNRLKIVRDEDGKILKRVDYKYLGTYQD